MPDNYIQIEEVESAFHNNTNLETLTFGMGCFWTPESRFGGIPGVFCTRVGFAGGTSTSPTYRKMGNHTETIEIDFDPNVISLNDLLRIFWENHYPNRDEYKGRQYISLLLFRTDGQKEIINEVKQEMEIILGEPIETEIKQFTGFSLAEMRHQKYYLKRYPKALDQLSHLYSNEEELIHSSFAARINGFVKGFITKDELLKDLNTWPIEEKYRSFLKNEFLKLKW